MHLSNTFQINIIEKFQMLESGNRYYVVVILCCARQLLKQTTQICN